MESLVNNLNAIIWSPLLVTLCLLAGVIFSVATRFTQIRHFPEMLRLLFSRRESSKGISSFQALSVSLSGRLGVGNIAGVAVAIGFGGPGAIFWMWIVAFFGAATSYAESTLGQIYKVEENGQYRGGPAYYFERCLGQRWLAILFSISTLIACGIFLPGVQANAVGTGFTQVVGEGRMISTPIGEAGTYTLIAMAFIIGLLAFIVFGGIKRIAHFAQVVVPFMALGFLLLNLTVVIVHWQWIPDMFRLIFSDAFTAQAGFGAAIGWGVKRGVYSNEAGQGTGPHAAAAAEVKHPAEQGLVQSFSVYVDTFLCTVTALMILITQQYNIVNADTQELIVQNIGAETIVNSAAFVQLSLTTVFGEWSQIFVGISLFFFAFTTILAYYYMTEINVSYLNRYFNNRVPLVFFQLLIMFMVGYGMLNNAGYIWNLGDIGVGLMAWINIVGILAILFVARPAILCLYDYERQLKAGGPMQFDPVKLGIKNATFWEERLAKAKQKPADE